MSRVEFEPTIPVFERAKKVHASDRSVTVGITLHYLSHDQRVLHAGT
jgi:hypothetical protein